MARHLGRGKAAAIIFFTNKYICSAILLILLHFVY